jgi:hypothetical protein
MDSRSRRSGSEPDGRTTPDAPGPTPCPDRPTVYRIRVKGHLDDRWADRREGLSITREDGGDTVLTVPVVDQAALHGLLRSLRDLGVPLVSINPAEPGQTVSARRKGKR